MDILDQLKGVVGAVAPVLANAILPGSGGVAAALLASLFGTSTDPQSLLTAVQTMTPEQAVAMKKIEFDHKEELIRIGVDMDKAILADIQNARNRDVAIQATGKSNHRANWMILGDVTGLCSCLVVLLMLPVETNEAIRVMLASIASVFGLCLRDAHTFEFGSSRGSKEKDLLVGVK